MYNILQKLITKHFYQSGADAGTKADVLYACNKLTDVEYADLTALIAQQYPPTDQDTVV